MKTLHNIIHIYNSLMLDRRYSTKYSLLHIQIQYGKYQTIFYGMLSVPHDIVMDLNNVMLPIANKNRFNFLKLVVYISSSN